MPLNVRWLVEQELCVQIDGEHSLQLSLVDKDEDKDEDEDGGETAEVEAEEGAGLTNEGEGAKLNGHTKKKGEETGQSIDDEAMDTEGDGVSTAAAAAGGGVAEETMYCQYDSMDSSLVRLCELSLLQLQLTAWRAHGGGGSRAQGGRAVVSGPSSGVLQDVVAFVAHQCQRARVASQLDAITNDIASGAAPAADGADGPMSELGYIKRVRRDMRDMWLQVEWKRCPQQTISVIDLRMCARKWSCNFAAGAEKDGSTGKWETAEPLAECLVLDGTQLLLAPSPTATIVRGRREVLGAQANQAGTIQSSDVEQWRQRLQSRSGTGWLELGSPNDLRCCMLALAAMSC